MSRSRASIIASAAGAAPLVVLAVAGVAEAQSDFRITHTQRRGPDRVDVNGKLFNDSRLHANNVVLTVSALDKAGVAAQQSGVQLQLRDYAAV